MNIGAKMSVNRAKGVHSKAHLADEQAEPYIGWAHI